MRVINNTGTRPIATIDNAGSAASINCSSEASSYVRMASVLKLNGRKINVIGSSFKTSTKTKSSAVNKLGRRIGKWMRDNKCDGEAPNERADSSRCGFMVDIPDSMTCKDMERKRARYANRRIPSVPLKISPKLLSIHNTLSSLIFWSNQPAGNMMPTAMTVPGTAYPSLTTSVCTSSRFPPKRRLTNDRNNAKTRQITDAAIASVILFKRR